MLREASGNLARIALRGLFPPEQGGSPRRPGAPEGASRARPLDGGQDHPRDGPLLPGRVGGGGQGHQVGSRLLHACRENRRHERDGPRRQHPWRRAARRVRRFGRPPPGAHHLPQPGPVARSPACRGVALLRRHAQLPRRALQGRRHDLRQPREAFPQGHAYARIGHLRRLGELPHGTSERGAGAGVTLARREHRGRLVPHRRVAQGA